MLTMSHTGGTYPPTKTATFPTAAILALAFSQMFNLLCERADNVHGGRLPHHVRVLWDEAANTGQVPNLEKLVAVIRSREVSLTLFYQQLAQCKAIYDKNAETILGNMDSVVFLGGREASTIKEISENWLGKATIPLAFGQRGKVGLCKLHRGDNGVVVGNLSAVKDAGNIGGKRCALHKGQLAAQHGGGACRRFPHVVGQIGAVRPRISQQLLFIQGLRQVKGLLRGVAENAVGFPL